MTRLPSWLLPRCYFVAAISMGVFGTVTHFPDADHKEKLCETLHKYINEKTKDRWALTPVSLQGTPTAKLWQLVQLVPKLERSDRELVRDEIIYIFEKGVPDLTTNNGLAVFSEFLEKMQIFAIAETFKDAVLKEDVRSIILDTIPRLESVPGTEFKRNARNLRVQILKLVTWDEKRIRNSPWNRAKIETETRAKAEEFRVLHSKIHWTLQQASAAPLPQTPKQIVNRGRSRSGESVASIWSNRSYPSVANAAKFSPPQSPAAPSTPHNTVPSSTSPTRRHRAPRRWRRRGSTQGGAS